ncbi:Acyl-lipid (7-3)-desaturase [Seminavis robusta]|uniref:Acyl-lipid (7-3)-desaturase n=1 Tax=Seminavis robusta TaxID=568900 RepID=A0A9N8DNZ2_9STRA|nr:Acyl-lipid (7-3)-desaturase [Seminavis robusta]|eukprot:Sro189_g081420.1 Acyl-lipid (7-3)-desaturase (462) ;mRNA; f:21704-23228
MAPDADKLRKRTPVTVHDNDEDAATKERTSNLKSLQANEVVIDGVIYDIHSFDHPGGDSINVFGGNDVTVPYKMIHPYHTDKHLEKMKRVGVVPGYVSEYKFDTEFEREIKKEVFQIVRRGKEFGTPGYFFRAFFYIALALYLQYQWMQQTSYTLAIIYGVSMACIGLNVQHDANHGAASRNVWVNNLLGFGADFIGGCKWLWMEKHWTHHAYTNHHEKDPDGLAAEPMLLFNDYPLGSPKRSAMHAYQAFYFVVVLAGYWHSSVFDIPQIWTLQDGGATGAGMKLDNNPWIRSRTYYALALRALYYACNIIIPLYNDFSWSTVAHINVMGIAGSLALGLLFTLSHNFENADRDPTADVRNKGEPVCWFKAQVETSSTYGGMIAGWLTGGLNFQIEHHLFPRMSSAWYPYIAPTVRKICKKHGVQYVYYPWVWQNMYSTLKYTHEVGNASHWKQNPFKGEQ